MSFVGKEPGDTPQVQHAYVQRLPVKAGVDIVKGGIYTIESTTGFMHSLAATSGDLTNLHGAYQALATSDSVTGESNGDRKVDFACPRSRIIVKSAANTVLGAKVTVSASNQAVDNDKVKTSTTHTIGTVFSIITGNEDGDKVKTADDDLIFLDVSF